MSSLFWDGYREKVFNVLKAQVFSVFVWMSSAIAGVVTEQLVSKALDEQWLG